MNALVPMEYVVGGGNLTCALEKSKFFLCQTWGAGIFSDKSADPTDQCVLPVILAALFDVDNWVCTGVYILARNAFRHAQGHGFEIGITDLNLFFFWSSWSFR